MFETILGHNRETNKSVIDLAVLVLILLNNYRPVLRVPQLKEYYVCDDKFHWSC